MHTFLLQMMNVIFISNINYLMVNHHNSFRGTCFHSTLGILFAILIQNWILSILSFEYFSNIERVNQF